MITVKFWGVRGSMPSTGYQYQSYGGNTSCIQIIVDNTYDFIIDAGTGIVNLGRQLRLSETPIYIFFTHFHWDHIQGLPFFAPLYMPGREINFIADRDPGWESCIFSQMQKNQFPVSEETLPSNRLFHQFNTFDHFSNQGINIETLPGNHPGKFTIYKINSGGKKIVCCSDNELSMKVIKTTEWDQLVDFFKDSDLLIHDSQYLPEEINKKEGWGHSHYEEVCALAEQAKVKRLVLTHHDPQRRDKDINEIKDRISYLLKGKKMPLSVTVAYEGLNILL